MAETGAASWERENYTPNADEVLRSVSVASTSTVSVLFINVFPVLTNSTSESMSGSLSG